MKIFIVEVAAKNENSSPLVLSAGHGTILGSYQQVSEPMHIGINGLVMKRGEYSGVHVATRGLINALVDHAEADDRFTVYTQRRAPDGLPLTDPRVNHVRPFWPVGLRTGRILWEQFRLFRRVFEDSIDLLHCPAYIMPRMCLKPVVLTVHDIFALRMPLLCTRSNRSHFKRLMPISLERARRIITPTAWVRDEVIEWNAARKNPIPDLAKKIVVVPWGIDARFTSVDDERRREELALKYGLPPQFVLFVGRIEPKKNLPMLIKSYFAAVMAGRQPHRLVIVGPKGWGATDAVRKTIREHGLENKVVMPGFIPEDELPTIYSMATCLYFPSYYEGFGLPVLEAMACGTAVISSETPAVKEIAGGAAHLANPQDLSSLRQALEDVLANDTLREKLVAAGLKRAGEFTWARHAESTRALYREVIAEDHEQHAAGIGRPSV